MLNRQCCPQYSERVLAFPGSPDVHFQFNLNNTYSLQHFRFIQFAWYGDVSSKPTLDAQR